MTPTKNRTRRAPYKCDRFIPPKKVRDALEFLEEVGNEYSLDKSGDVKVDKSMQNKIDKAEEIVHRYYRSKNPAAGTHMDPARWGIEPSRSDKGWRPKSRR